MFGILVAIRDVHILWANELLGGGEVPNVAVLHDVIVVLRHSGDQDYQLPDVYCDSTDCWEWELCFAAVSNIGGLLHTWTGDAYFWHGRAFPFWWYQSHNNAGCVKHGQTILELVITGWNVAVYVQNKPADFEGLCDNYLQYIGGQNKNICARHDVPLIAAVGDRKTVCVCIASVNPDLYPPFPKEYLCCKWSLLCCSIWDCKVGICKQHAVSSGGLHMELHPISWDACSIASGKVGNSLDNLVVVIEGMDLVCNGGVVAYDSLRSIPSSTDGSGTLSKADGLLALDPGWYPSSDMLHDGTLNVNSAVDRLPSLHSGGANTNLSSPLVDLSRVPSGTRSSEDDINYLLSLDSIEDSMEANRLGGMPELLAGLRSSSIASDVLQRGDDVKALLSLDSRVESNATILSTQLPALLPGSGNSSIASAVPCHYDDSNDDNDLIGLDSREASAASLLYLMLPNHPSVHTINISDDEEGLSNATYMSVRNESVLVDIKADSLSSIESHPDGNRQAIMKGKIPVPEVDNSSQNGCELSSVSSCHCDRCVA